VLLSLLVVASHAIARDAAPATASQIGVGAQYDTTHVYVAPEDVDRFVASLLATFGGRSTKQVLATVTPTSSSTTSQLLQTPVGTVSVFGFKTPIPYPFGAERTGYLVTDLDKAITLAKASGAEIVVAAFSDPIGRDAVIQWPGGINMQLYWHTTKPSYPALETIPENRVYASPGRADAFTRDFLRFSHGKVVSDESHAPGIDVGRPNDSIRRIRIDSVFGKITVFVTEGHLPYPYGRELTGYEVANLKGTLNKATASGATILVAPFSSENRSSAIVQFPGGYIAEIHAPAMPFTWSELTPRERAILIQVLEGRLNKQIAGEMGVTETTAKMHRSNMMRKFKAGSVAELCRMVDKLRLLPENPKPS
jgi:DNA-binding CsgD family transcriptional regulator